MNVINELRMIIVYRGENVVHYSVSHECNNGINELRMIIVYRGENVVHYSVSHECNNGINAYTIKY